MDIEKMLAMLEERSSGANKAKDFANRPTEEILERLEKYQPRNITNQFEVGDIVTQTFHIDDDGDVIKAYKYPLPGQPARVVGIVPRQFQSLEVCDGQIFKIMDTVVATRIPSGIMEFVVSSRYFRKWVPGEKVPQEIIDNL